MTRSDPELNERSRNLAPVIWQSDCLDFGEFTLTSGKTSPYYVDLRSLPSHPDRFDRVIEMAAELVDDRIGTVDSVCAVATGGLPVGTLLAHKLNTSMSYVRQQKKSHGEGHRIEGRLENNEDVLVVDDISTTGGSVLDAVETVRNNGGRVKYALVLLDRCQGATDNLATEGVDLVSLGSIEPLVEELGERGAIAQSVVQNVKKYLAKE